LFTYYNAADSGDRAGFYDGNGNYVTNSFNQGSGSFIKNQASSPLTLTYVGNVVQGTNVLAIKQGFNALSWVPPICTNIDSALGGFVGTSDPNGITNDVYYAFNNGWTLLTYYSAADSGDRAGFYDGNGNYQSTNSVFFPKVGQAFFINHVAAGIEYWTNNFSAQ
jgi:hypothetical protein